MGQISVTNFIKITLTVVFKKICQRKDRRTSGHRISSSGLRQLN